MGYDGKCKQTKTMLWQNLAPHRDSLRKKVWRKNIECGKQVPM